VLQEGFGNPSDQSWIAAYKALQYSQWLADIDAIRIDLLGKDGKICIYGVSGGGQLAHTYLAAYGANVRYAYTESAVFPTLEAEIGLQHDQFWHEITPNERKRLWDVLSAHPEKREFYAQLLQRQNFFVDLKVLPQERLKLIEAIAKNDNAAIKKASADYQVDTLNKLMSAPEAWSIRVREYEFAWPLLRNLDWKKSEFRPDLEDSELWASPLLALQQRGQIAAPGIDLAPLCDVGAQVTIIAGRYDHTCDYRTQIALASHYRNHLLRLLDDDHQMHRLKSLSGARAALLQAWTKGWDSPAFAQALAMIEPIRWHED
jgi:hypothetical protein